MTPTEWIEWHEKPSETAIKDGAGEAYYPTVTVLQQWWTKCNESDGLERYTDGEWRDVPTKKRKDDHIG